jgi:hypothetical protein
MRLTAGNSKKSEGRRRRKRLPPRNCPATQTQLNPAIRHQDWGRVGQTLTLGDARGSGRRTDTAERNPTTPFPPRPLPHNARVTIAGARG